MINYKEILDNFDVKTLIIKDYKYWLWVLRKDQVTIGSSIIISKENHKNLCEISTEGFLELKKVLFDVEHSIKKAFNYSEINYLTLMMVDPIVHTHIIPRYKSAVKFNKKLYIDEIYPYPPNLEMKQNLLFEEKLMIINYIKKHI
tara:strand:- start:64 stop:498 length:435 start_codon:yes stop_codon:yes gene_type:complete